MTMHAVRQRTGMIVILAVCASAACGAEAIIAPIIILTNTWAEEGNPEHTFSFSDDTNGESQAEGTFTGTETLPDLTEFDFEGDWSHGRVEFTVHRAEDVTYTGTIPEDDANRIEYHSSAGNLVLVR